MEVAVMLRFLKPGKIKLAFVLPWLLYLTLELILGHNILLPVSGLTLVLLYICAGIAEILAVRMGKLGFRNGLLIGAVGLAAADHLGKLAVVQFLPMGTHVTLIPGSFYLQQVLNMEAAWLPNKFGFEVPLLFLSGAAILIMLITVAVYNYYSIQHQRTIYTDLALVLIIAGALSAFGDQVSRGYTVDYIVFHGFFVADLKDIFLTLGVGCVTAEAMISPTEDTGFKELPVLLSRIIKYNLRPKQNK